jgi:hypothetical protein
MQEPAAGAALGPDSFEVAFGGVQTIARGDVAGRGLTFYGHGCRLSTTWNDWNSCKARSTC